MKTIEVLQQSRVSIETEGYIMAYEESDNDFRKAHSLLCKLAKGSHGAITVYTELSHKDIFLVVEIRNRKHWLDPKKAANEIRTLAGQIHLVLDDFRNLNLRFSSNYY